jgi:hypothetical protein
MPLKKATPWLLVKFRKSRLFCCLNPTKKVRFYGTQRPKQKKIYVFNGISVTKAGFGVQKA